VIGAEPLHAEARRQLGALYRKRERPSEARRCFEVLSADHDSARGKLLLARVLEERGAPELARELRLAARPARRRCVTQTTGSGPRRSARSVPGRLEAAALAALEAHPRPLLPGPALGAGPVAAAPARRPCARVEAWFAAHPEDAARWQLEVADG
jgi:hypothetical protein